MDFYEGVVLDYLRADRAVFVNTQCCIQIEDGPNPDVCKPHWYCDAVAVDFRNQQVLLCEISYAEKLNHFLKRLKAWNEHWTGLCAALERDCKVPKDWPVRPWLFIPEHSLNFLTEKLNSMGSDGQLKFSPRITLLESTQPWRYKSWSHEDRNTDKSNVLKPYRL